MKTLLVSTALAAAMSFAPAFAQEAPAKTDAPVETESSTSGTVSIQGVKPSDALGAIDTSKLVTAPSPAAEGEPTVKPYVAAEASAPVEPEPAAVQTASVDVSGDVPIAEEVKDVVESGKKYTTNDLVLAQLEAVKNAPVPEPNVTTTTVTSPTAEADKPAERAEPGIEPASLQGSPVFDKAIRPADWSISASTEAPPTKG